MRRLLTLLFVALLTSVGIASAEIYSGTCGENLTWDLNTETGVFNIVGYGEMDNYGEPSGPWRIYSASITTINLPDGLTSVGEFSFVACSNLTSITIPNTVTTIGQYAFTGCTSLTSVTMPNSITSIGVWAFRLCPLPVIDNIRYAGKYLIEVVDNTLSTYTIQEGTLYIGCLAFEECTNMTSITIPNSVRIIDNYAFKDCSNLKSITIPNSVTSIGKSAFSGCEGLPVIDDIRYADTYLIEAIDKSLSSYTIKEGTRFIGSSAFSGCSALTSFNIPNSVINIGWAAFSGCSNLASVTIGSGVSALEDYSFSSCPKLKDLYMMSVIPPTVKYYAFSKTDIEAVYVPIGGVINYRNSPYWERKNIQSIATINQIIENNSTSCTITFTIDNIATCGTEEGETFAGNTLEYVGLEPNSEYKEVPIVLTTHTGETDIINVSFTTSALELATQPAKAVSENTAILMAETNIADIETSCGFEWRGTNDPEEMASRIVYCPVSNGIMAGRLKGLDRQDYYKYRAFYKSAAGNMYYGYWDVFSTKYVDVTFEPIVTTYAASNVTETQATLKGYALAGADDFSEQGFEYWAESRVSTHPAPQRRTDIGERQTIVATGMIMKVTLTDLDEGTVYKYRTYAKFGSETIYGSEMSFITEGEYVEPTAIEEITNDQISKCENVKILHDGQILILREGRVYTLTGQEIR